jgi:hypothetical protein
MKPSDLDDPEIRKLGRRWTLEAYDIASELEDHGADASQLLLSHKDQDATRPHTVTLPTMMVDVIQAILLSLPRQKGEPDQPLGENVTRLRFRAVFRLPTKRPTARERNRP